MPKYYVRKPTALATLAAIGIGSLLVSALLPSQPAQAIIVFDPNNYSQNILTAARTLSQIDNQIRSLQNEATMLMNMDKNLRSIDFPELDALRSKLQEIDRLMGQAQGVDFRVEQLEARFRQLYPTDFMEGLSSNGRMRDARARLEASMAAFRQTMAVQSRVVGNIHDDAETLNDLVARSQGAEGSLQAQQATNQLLALAAKQQFQVQQMMAAQFRSEAVEQARRAAEAAEARASTKQFLGSGSAYMPH